MICSARKSRTRNSSSTSKITKVRLGAILASPFLLSWADVVASLSLGDGSYDSCLTYTINLFREKFGGPDSQFHVFVTVSLAQESIKKALDEVKELLRKRLEEVL